MAAILRLKSFFCVSILLSLILLSSCAKYESTFEDKLASIEDKVDHALGKKKKIDPEHNPFVKLPIEDLPNHPYAYQTTYEALLLSGFNYLESFNVADYTLDFINTFSGVDDALPNDNALVANYINQHMKMLQDAEFGISEDVKIGDYIRGTHSYRFSPISPYKIYAVFSPTPSHGQGKLPDKITYQFVNAAQIKELKLSNSYLDLHRANTYITAKIIFHVVGINYNDITKVRAKIDIIQLYDGVLIKTIRL